MHAISSFHGITNPQTQPYKPTHKQAARLQYTVPQQARSVSHMPDNVQKMQSTMYKVMEP